MFDQILSHITDELQGKIDAYEAVYEVHDVGRVLEAGDGIAQVDGLNSIHAQELVEFENDVKGIAFNLQREQVGVIILGEYQTIKEGMQVKSTGRIVSVPVGDELIGRVVNALGEPIDGKGSIPTRKYRPIERLAPGVLERQDVDTPLQTGIKAIDSMIPIGKGQRQLIIGDRQTGKTAIAFDAIINQKGKDVICIYVAIGQKKAQLARQIALLEKFDAMKHTIVVAASADEPAAMQYIAPYAGSAIGEELMEQGKDALIIFDDLSKHAWAYRQVSLLLRRPPGREAYPGDLFYLHSRLLERAARLAYQYVIVPSSFEGEFVERSDGLNGLVFGGPVGLEDARRALSELPEASHYKLAKVKGTGGSLTALPIIETLLGDVSAYVPTNVISITDGQIYLESDLFNAGVRPAVNIGISVSRVGGAAQAKCMKQVASRLRLDMASFRALAAFAQFGSDLDKSALAQLNRGRRLQEILKQPQYKPVSLEDQIIVLYAGTHGMADHVEVNRMREWENELLRFVNSHYPAIGEEIAVKRVISEDLEKQLVEAIKTFNSTWEM
ncbi:MAG: F0F1 ATP synthase subunit alpha [Chloroflexi bacterium]|nr:F0F1 ATP synthase subunit alpha [Chloroflexota bacterium]